MQISKAHSAGLLAWIVECNRHARGAYLDFLIEDIPVGAVHRERLPLFAAEPDVFRLDADGLRLHPRLDTPERRTQALDALLKTWHARGLLSGWRNEPYQIAADYHGPPLMRMERAATSLFGVRKYGVHLNGYTRRDGRLCMWIARRSRHSPTYPGCLDQLVAGGLTAGYSPSQVLLKECAEEAALPRELAAQARPAGLVSYCMEHAQNLVRDTLFIYDLEVPEGFSPRNTDGEVEDFYLWPLERVVDTVAKTREFKANTNLVVIDFLARHGYLAPEHPHYVEIVRGLRQ